MTWRFSGTWTGRRPPSAVRVRIAELDGVTGRSLVGFQERQQLAEDLRRVAAVDLLDDHYEIRGRIRRRVADRLHEYAVCQSQLPVSHGTPASDEVFVGEIRMELDGTDLAFVSLANERERQTLCEPNLTGTRRALKDEVLPGPKPFEHAFNLLAFDEASVGEYIRD